jgi:hypothetical protein
MPTLRQGARNLSAGHVYQRRAAGWVGRLSWRNAPPTSSLRSEVSDMSIYDEYRIVINAAQRRLIMRALTNAMANGRRSTDALGPMPDEWVQLIRLFSTIKPMPRLFDTKLPMLLGG